MTGGPAGVAGGPTEFIRHDSEVLEMPVMTRSMMRRALTEGLAWFTEFAENPPTKDADLNNKIMFQAMLQRREIFERLFADNNEFSANIHDICVRVLKGTARPDLRSVCRRVLKLFWSRSPSRSRSDPIEAARKKACADVETRMAARLAELHQVDLKKDKETAVAQLIPLLSAPGWMAYILEHQLVFRYIFLEDPAFAEEIRTAIKDMPLSTEKIGLVQMLLDF